jgi:hypothetical protein
MLIERERKKPASQRKDPAPEVSFALFKHVVNPTSKKPAIIKIIHAIYAPHYLN